MRFAAFFGAGLSLASLFSAVASVAAEEAFVRDPEVIATATFPEDNTFNHIVNGQKNTITITLENKSNQNLTLLSVAGSLTHPDTNALVKNLTSIPFGNVLLAEKLKINIPYTFYSQFKPGDHRLNIWVQHSDGDKVYTVDAYESVITVIEAPLSIFDLKMLSTYLIVLAILGGAGYYTYRTLAPPKKKSKKTPAQVSAPVGTVTATGAGGYQEEWIPEHHLKKAKKSAGGATSGTSADELSGAELSATEGRRRKGKK
ncbi:hypothetical protein FA13DRAFT_1729360 [Coprinellus micaceus]|uniref:Uncharacterized protein n=1 Tax=Coprinellus micaceus TaxID=71717 RepID=A0A4Y7TL52_COPMI|nr:hypothetical protein FA13DRAFT_1729360 [Coprinellus micaceus]